MVLLQTLRKYDVFISFRGEDTRKNFTRHLQEDLCQKQIRTFIDYELPRGREISLSLLEAIEDSYVSVVVFSENYASSEWCLEELCKIMQCWKDEGQVVIPVFYGIDPSHVRKQEGSYKKAFERYEQDYFRNNSNMEKVQKWRDALTQAANLAGWDSHSPAYRDNVELLQNIVQEVLRKLNDCHYSSDALEGLFGIEKSCVSVESLMKEDQLVGIWGMGGIGKTTIARVLFAKHHKIYEGSCFLEDVRERSGKYGERLRDLRNQLYSELLGVQICQSSGAKSTFVKRRLFRQKKLIVLDDVSTSEQLKYLIGELQLDSPGSRIIITTRDKSVLESSRVKKIHKVEELDFEKSLQLFNLNAFNEDYSLMGYKELSQRAVVYCKGIPLALKVLGSFLHSKSENEWDSALRKLEKITNEDIQNVLSLSYDSLNDKEQEILLDIACFFKGEPKNSVISLLDGCGFYAVIGMRTLHDKALINISGDYVLMHDLIQAMGREIVRRESIKYPEKRSRLWDCDDICEVLKHNKGTAAIEGIMLDVSQINQNLQLSAETFKNMPNLRLLKIYSSSDKFGEQCNMYFPMGLESFSHKLRYIQWSGYPLKSLPQNLCAELLVDIHMPNSHVEELWQGIQDLQNLKRIELRRCERLMELPNLSRASKLEHVDLYGCSSLCELHPSLLSLDTLVSLHLFGCKKLKSLKSEKHLTSLRDIYVGGCVSLKEFSLLADSIYSLDLTETGIEILHSSIGCLKSLQWLVLDGSKLKNLPNELSCLTSLHELSISGCTFEINKAQLHVLFDGLQSLTRLHLEGCHNLSEIPDNIGMLSSLKELRLDGSNIETLPTNIKHLQELQYISLKNCRKLQCLPEFPPFIWRLDVGGCTSLMTMSSLKSYAPLKKGVLDTLIGDRAFYSFEDCMKLDENSLDTIMEGTQISVISAAFYNASMSEKYHVVVFWPGSKIPKEFPYPTTQSSIINLDLSSRPYGFFFFLVLHGRHSRTMRDSQITCDCYVEDGRMVSNVIRVYTRDLILDHVVMTYDPCYTIPRTYEGSVSFVFRCVTDKNEDVASVVIKECGVRPIYAQDFHTFLGELELEFHKNVDLESKFENGLAQMQENLLDSLTQVSGSEERRKNQLCQRIHQRTCQRFEQFFY